MLSQQSFNNVLSTLKQRHAPINEHYLQQIATTIEAALQQHTRVFALRVDLHFPHQDNDMPSYLYRSDSAVISRFIDALKAKIAAETQYKKRIGKSVHPCHLHYIWARERNESHNDHYHLLLLFNKDRYFTLGDFSNKNEDTLLNKIRAAWASALSLEPGDTLGLVYIPANGEYHLNKQSAPEQLEEAMYALLLRAGYLAKQDTKVSGPGNRGFGCSRFSRS